MKIRRCLALTALGGENGRLSVLMAFFVGIHAEFGRQGRQTVQEFKPSHSYERYSVDETVNNASMVSEEILWTGVHVSIRGRGLGTWHDRFRTRKVNCSMIQRPRNSGSNPLQNRAPAGARQWSCPCAPGTCTQRPASRL